MMAQTTATETRRTRSDLRALVAQADGDLVESEGPSYKRDLRRLDRLRAHGWVTDDNRLTANGDRIVRVVRTLDDWDELDLQVDIMGMGPFMDVVTRVPPDVALDYFGEVQCLVNMVDEARHKAGTLDVHDPNGPMFKSYDARRGTVEVAFEDARTANIFRRDWVRDRWASERKHDFRFGDNRNPRRIVVDVNPDA